MADQIGDADDVWEREAVDLKQLDQELNRIQDPLDGGVAGLDDMGQNAAGDDMKKLMADLDALQDPAIEPVGAGDDDAPAGLDPAAVGVADDVGLTPEELADLGVEGLDLEGLVGGDEVEGTAAAGGVDDQKADDGVGMAAAQEQEEVAGVAFSGPGAAQQPGPAQPEPVERESAQPILAKPEPAEPVSSDEKSAAVEGADVDLDLEGLEDDLDEETKRELAQLEQKLNDIDVGDGDSESAQSQQPAPISTAAATSTKSAGFVSDDDVEVINHMDMGGDDPEMIDDFLTSEANAAEAMPAPVRSVRRVKRGPMPQINPMSQSIKRRSTVEDALSEWNKTRERRLRQKREDLRRYESRVYSGRPKINKKSRRMFAAAQRASHAPRSLRVEERLLERGRTVQERQRQRKQLEAERSAAKARPRITGFAAQLARDGSVGDRLMRAGQEMKKRREAVKIRVIEAEQAECYQAPALRRPRDKRQAASVHEDLYRRGLHTTYKREALRKVASAPAPSVGITSKRSRKIASKLKTSTKERLLSGTLSIQRHRRERAQERAEEERLAEREREAKRNKRRAATKGLWGRLYEEGALRKRDQEYAEQRKADRELYECTFQPHIRPSSSERGGDPQREGGTAEATVQRLYAWKKNIDERRQREQRQRASAKLQDCTFHPRIDRAVSNAASGMRSEGGPASEAAAKRSHARVGSPVARSPDAAQRDWDDAYFEEKLHETQPSDFPVRLDTTGDDGGGDDRTSAIESLQLLPESEYTTNPAMALRWPLSRTARVWYPATEKERVALAAVVARTGGATKAARVAVRRGSAQDTFVQRQRAARAERDRRAAAAAARPGKRWAGGKRTVPRPFKLLSSTPNRGRFTSPALTGRPTDNPRGNGVRQPDFNEFHDNDISNISAIGLVDNADADGVFGQDEYGRGAR